MLGTTAFIYHLLVFVVLRWYLNVITAPPPRQSDMEWAEEWAQLLHTAQTFTGPRIRRRMQIEPRAM